MVFHLVSRLHRREPWFVPGVRDEVASLIRRMTARTDADLLAYAVMSNHLHVLVRQGEMELAAIMQPLLCRVAHRVQQRHGFEGTVVERRYRDRLCVTPDHVREAVMYVHLNPWRAGLCEEDLGYRWTTHAAYLPGADPDPFGIDPHAQLAILELFAQAEGRTGEGLRQDYLTWLRCRIRQDSRRNDVGDDAGIDVPNPDPRIGDRAWRLHFGPFLEGKPARWGRPRPDLRDYVTAQLPGVCPDYKLTDLRGSWLPRPVARCRTEVIRVAAARGYQTTRIAQLFGISPATVSRAKHSADRKE